MISLKKDHIPLFLAPMAGVTDLPFRRLASELGATATIGEMVASEALLKGEATFLQKLSGEGLENSIIQLAGREAYWMAEAARFAEDNGAHAIDINMGCPARRVTGGYSGAALMQDIDHAAHLIRAVVAAVKCPVSVKMRLGWDEDNFNAPELARRAEAVGVHMMSVHGRTRNQFYKGDADWAKVAQVVAAVTVPVLVNGDIVCGRTLQIALQQSGARGAMIGRGAIGRPWIFGQLQRDEAVRPPENIGTIILTHYEAMLGVYGQALGGRVARKHLAAYMRHCPLEDCFEDKRISQEILREESPARVIGLLECRFGKTGLASGRGQEAMAAIG